MSLDSQVAWLPYESSSFANLYREAGIGVHFLRAAGAVLRFSLPPLGGFKNSL